MIVELHRRMRIGSTMPKVPPDPRTVLNARIHHFKKQTQKLNLEFLEASEDLERAKKAVLDSRSQIAGAASPGEVTPLASPPPLAKLAQPPTAEVPADAAIAVTVRPFAEGVGYALIAQSANLWFDNEAHAIKYAKEVFPHCVIHVVDRDGSVSQSYDAT
jgi:hypothetical protein